MGYQIDDIQIKLTKMVSILSGCFIILVLLFFAALYVLFWFVKYSLKMLLSLKIGYFWALLQKFLAALFEESTIKTYAKTYWNYCWIFPNPRPYYSSGWYPRQLIFWAKSRPRKTGTAFALNLLDPEVREGLSSSRKVGGTTSTQKVEVLVTQISQSLLQGWLLYKHSYNSLYL